MLLSQPLQTYAEHALVREMLETPRLIRQLPLERIHRLSAPPEHVLLTGEGSSRIFPAQHIVSMAHRYRFRQTVFSESASSAVEFSLSDEAVYVASNSGKTAECVRLMRALRERRFDGRLVGIAAAGDSPVVAESDESYTLSCGPEEAVAATKSVVEQALLYDLHFRAHNELPTVDLEQLARDFGAVLELPVSEELTAALAAAPVVYFAGRNDGVAEELTLKANEIVRARSDFLPGTYAVHGIEEVMNPSDVLIWIDPPAEWEGKFREVLEKGVGLRIFAIASRETSFPTVTIPAAQDELIAAYLQLAAGWRILVEVGRSLGFDIDKPQRARKVGNEYRTAE